MTPRVWAGLLALGMLVGMGAAAENQAETTLVYPCAPAPGAVRIDGKLDPAEWGRAATVSSFLISGAESLAPEQVVMRVMYDRTHLYLGVTCVESRMKHLVTTATQRDGAFWLDDSIEFFVDANHDHASYQQFAVTAKGALYDAMGEAGITHDSTWNCDWRATVSRGDKAWTVEAAVPLSAFGAHAPKPGTLWGFNLCRERRAGGGKLELYNWANVERRFNNAPLFGHLRFVPAGWQPNAPSVQAAARHVGGACSIVYATHGTWQVERGKPARWRTYRESLRTLSAAPSRLMAELRATYKKRPKMTLRKEFEELAKTHRQVLALIAGKAPVGAEACAQARAHLQTLNDRVEAIYWRVRVVMLNETM